MRRLIYILTSLLIICLLIVLQIGFLNQVFIFGYYFDLVLLIVIIISLKTADNNKYWLIILLALLMDLFTFHWGVYLISYSLTFLILQLLIKKVFTSETFYRNSILIIIATGFYYLNYFFSHLIIYLLIENPTSLKLNAILNQQFFKQIIIQFIINLVIINILHFLRQKFNQWYLLSDEKKYF